MSGSQPTSNNAPICMPYCGYHSRLGSGLLYQNLKVPAANKHSHLLRHFVISCLTMADEGGGREISPKTPIFILACSEAKPTLYCTSPANFPLAALHTLGPHISIFQQFLANILSDQQPFYSQDMTHRKTPAVCLLQKPPPCNRFRQAVFKEKAGVMTKIQRKLWQHLHTCTLTIKARIGQFALCQLTVKPKPGFADRNEGKRTNTMGQHSQQEGLRGSLVFCHRSAGVAGSRDSKTLTFQVTNNFRTC